MDIVFDNWEAVLRTEVPPDRQRAYREAIVKFRYWLLETGKAPVEETFKAHLAWKQSYLPPEKFEIRRDALRWYYREGRRRMQAGTADKTLTGLNKSTATPAANADGVPSAPRDAAPAVAINDAAPKANIEISPASKSAGQDAPAHGTRVAPQRVGTYRG